jgi:phosphonate transport system substrate-binding protein
MIRTGSARAKIAATIILGFALGHSGMARAAEKLHFAVGPLLPTATETTKAWDPFFKHLAAKLDAPYDLVATTDWAGISVALASSQVDLAWMGPWGYILANDDSGAQAIATAKYDGKPIYYAIVIARPELKVANWPEDGKGLRMAFADAGSTSGWLIPTWWFKSRGIDPHSFFQYRDGNTHAANEIAVASGQTDFATDYDRNRNSMIERGTIKADATKVVWTSDPLPNDAIAVRKGFDPALAKRIQDIVVAIDEDTAKTLLPTHYTGFVPATHDSYKIIEQAGVTVGRLKPRS